MTDTKVRTDKLRSKATRCFKWTTVEVQATCADREACDGSAESAKIAVSLYI